MLRPLLPFVALVLPFLAGCATTGVVSQSGDTLHHPDLHLSVTKPTEWRFQTPKEKRDARHANTYANKLYDSEVKLDAFPPRIVVSKYSEPHRGLNPQVAIDRYPLDDLRFKTAPWLVNLVLRNRQYVFDNIEIVEPTHVTVIGNKSAAGLRLRYVLAVDNGPAQRIDEHIWVVATGITAYLITTRIAQDGPDANLQEIYRIVGSLKFD